LRAVLERRNGQRRFVTHGPSLNRSSHCSPVTMAAVAAAPRAHAAAPPPAQAAGAGANLPVPQQLPQFIVPDVVEDRRTDSAGNIVVRKYLRGKLLGKVRCASVSGCLLAGVGSATFCLSTAWRSFAPWYPNWAAITQWSRLCAARYA
jgi:hypothetical protein